MVYPDDARGAIVLAMKKLLFLSLICLAPLAGADAITTWNKIGCDAVFAAQQVTPMAVRTLALMHTAAYEAADSITRRYPVRLLDQDAPKEASVEAAIAAASRTVLLELVPTQKEAIEAGYANALAPLPANARRDAGIAAGERAAKSVLAMRADDGVKTQESYRPQTTPGAYVMTSLPAVPQWPSRKPWLMTSATQFRPGPPPALTSERYARDYNEIKAVGAKFSTTRTAEQTAIARFWTVTSPAVYHELVRGAIDTPDRDLMRNVRLFAALTQAMDDAFIAVFDAKYNYAYWRPITAIRNRDRDGNDATERDASWLPFIETPPHPEYPCAHCIAASTVATVLAGDLDAGAVPPLATTSNTADGAVRHWPNLQAFVSEVGNARIYDGVHYRNSTEVAADMGRKIGALAVAKYFGN
jgi:hypothetical protein